jgi:LPXTG-motif cell wall-anchored protein
LTSVRITPNTVTLNPGQSIALSAIAGCGSAGDESQNLINTTYSWVPSGVTLSATTGANVTATAGSASGTVTVTATQDGITKQAVRSISVTIPSTPTPVDTPVDPASTPVLPAVDASTNQALVSPTAGGTVASQDAAGTFTVPVGAVQNQFVAIRIKSWTSADVKKPIGYIVGSNVKAIDTTDMAGAVYSNFAYLVAAEVCLTYTADEFQLAHHSEIAMFKEANPEASPVKLTTTLDHVNKQACGKTMSTSIFFLGLAETPFDASVVVPPTPVVVPPTPVVLPPTPTPDVVLPATGDIAPGTGLLIGLGAAGLAFISVGVYALRRRRAEIR